MIASFERSRPAADAAREAKGARCAPLPLTFVDFLHEFAKLLGLFVTRL
jgi:hypothetical protein